MHGCRRVALDTNSCIYFLQREPTRFAPVSEIVSKAVSGPVQIELSGIVLMELLIHPYKSGDLHELSRVRQFTERQRGITTVEVSRSVAFASAAIRAMTGLKLPDAIVAGSAALSGCDVILGNDRKFQKLRGHQSLTVLSLGAKLRMPRYIHIDDYLEAA